MAKGLCTFRKADLKRGVEALKSAGVEVTAVEVQDGKIRFILNNGVALNVAHNEWDLGDQINGTGQIEIR